MPRVLVIHHDESALSRIAKLLGDRYEFMAIDNLASGVKYIPKIKPDVIVAGYDREKREASRLLRFLKEKDIAVPVVAVAMDGHADPKKLKHLGARAVLNYPFDAGTLDAAIGTTVKLSPAQLAGPRPITDTELNGNLSVLQNELNGNMQCFAGRNLVYIHSFILRDGTKTKPRIALRCPLREEMGMLPDVYYEFIRDVCCCDPGVCEAYQQFQAGRESA